MADSKRRRSCKQPAAKLCIQVIVFLLITLIVALGSTRVAYAHASLVETTPSNGDVVALSPTSVDVEFSESVIVQSDSIRLFDSSGKRIQLPSTQHLDGDQTIVSAAVPVLAKDSYIVSWKVISLDSHPVQGAFTFSIGIPKAIDSQLIDQVSRPGKGSTLTKLTYNTSKFAATMTLCLSIGLVAFQLAISKSRRLERNKVLRSICITSLVSNLSAAILYLPYSNNGSLFNGFSSDRLSSLIAAEPFQSWLLRCLVAMAFVVAATSSAMFKLLSNLTAQRVILGVLANLGLLAITIGSHAISGRWIAIAFLSTFAHVCAISVWFGGLTGLLTSFRSSSNSELRVITLRFSNVALVCVCIVLISGVFQSIRQTGSLAAWIDTSYGLTLIVKITTFSLLLAFAGASRYVLKHVKNLGASALLKLVFAEVLVIILIFAVTTSLTTRRPGITGFESTYSGTLVDKDVTLSMVIGPLRADEGNDFHLSFTTSKGSLYVAEEVEVSLTNVERGVGPIVIPDMQLLHNHVMIIGYRFAFPGSWSVRTKARFGEVNSYTFTVVVKVR